MVFVSALLGVGEFRQDAAEIGDTHVVTFDRKLKAAFPDRVLTASEYLSNAT